MKKRILVIAAHPDDEVLGCGGTLAKFSKLDYKINVIFLSDGVASRNLNLNKKKGDILKRRKSSYKAAKVLGVNKIEFFSFPDNQFDTAPFLSIVKLIEETIKKYAPSIILTHYDNDLNIDHKIVSKAVVTASRPYLNYFVKKILLFEVLSSSEWNFSSLPKPFSPNLFIDINQDLKKKIKAMRCYSQELRRWPHPRSLEGITNLAKLRGSTSGLKFAEAFVMIREIID